MSLLAGSPALRLLARRKLRGHLRRTLSRMRTPVGALIGLVGLGVFALWIVAIQIPSWTASEPTMVDPQSARRSVGLGGILIGVLTLSGSLNHRGLFLPREEIELLFSAPVSRSDLVRYRLLANMGRASFAGVIFGLLVMRHMPVAVFAFGGTFVAMQTLPILGQMVAIMTGLLERRWLVLLRRWPGGLLSFLSVMAIGALFAALTMGDLGGSLGEWANRATSEGAGALAGHPLVAALLMPFEPWARMIAAENASAFMLWLGVCLVIWLCLFELTARLPIDFRELSLETSANVAERIRRAQRSGGGVSATKASKFTATWHVPWMFGRGPGGAIAWRKTSAIVRKARGTLLVSVLILCLVTIFVSSTFNSSSNKDVLGGSLLITVLGTLYLGAGLRFDYREDLDRMAAIKAWPVGPMRAFVFTILPEVFLIASLVSAGVVARCAWSMSFHIALLPGLLALPMFVFAWVGLDNAVFLFAPVRITPGQDGALHNTGRAMVVMFVRGILAMLLLAVIGGVGLLCNFVAVNLLGAGHAVGIAAGVSGTVLVMFASDVFVAWTGGKLLRRFDLSRERG